MDNGIRLIGKAIPRRLIQAKVLLVEVALQNLDATRLNPRIVPNTTPASRTPEPLERLLRRLRANEACNLLDARVLEELAQDYATLWLSLFKEYGISTPSGWPYMCAVERPVKRRVERRRERMKNRLQARVNEVAAIQTPSST